MVTGAILACRPDGRSVRVVPGGSSFEKAPRNYYSAPKASVSERRRTPVNEEADPDADPPHRR